MLVPTPAKGQSARALSTALRTLEQSSRKREFARTFRLPSRFRVLTLRIISKRSAKSERRTLQIRRAVQDPSSARLQQSPSAYTCRPPPFLPLRVLIAVCVRRVHENF